MWLIKDRRSGKLYKTKYSIENDRLSHLYSYYFVKSGVLTECECLSNVRCLDKFPFIEVIGKVDGRMKGVRNYEYFSWGIVTIK